MGDLIRRDSARRIIESPRNKEQMLIALESIAPVEPERKSGKWIERNPKNSDKCRLIECDQCGFSHIVGFNVPYEDWIENRNFCERCGADMRQTRNIEYADNDTAYGGLASAT